jgi:2-oxoglutarate ferredoxin oxidoreductase subunit alpha
MEKQLWKGNEAIAEAAVRAGCKSFFGYPITPQNEIPEYMSSRLPQVDGVFVQSESEVSAINMVFGAAASGVRVMTSSSSPGLSLKQEGISYLAGAELPAVIVNIMRGGPGLGTIQPSQGDYFQATRGGGNGDYRTIVLAPCNIQEAVDLTQDAFDLADKYRTPVLVAADGIIGQMMEPVVWKEHTAPELPSKPWTASGRKGREKNNYVTSLRMNAEDCEHLNKMLEKKYAEITSSETRWEEKNTEDAEFVIAAYGTPSRIALSAIEALRSEGIKAGLYRPITLWPFPSAALEELAAKKQVKGFLVLEMSTGQMLDDVRLAVSGKKPVAFYGRTGGVIPKVADVIDVVRNMQKGGA